MENFIHAFELLQAHPIEAEECFDELVQKYPDNPQIIRGCGLAKFGVKKWEEARCLLTKAMSREPEHEWGSISLFLTLYNLGRYEEAYEEVRRFVEQTGTFTEEYDLALADLRDEIEDAQYNLRIQDIDNKNKK